MKRFFLFLTIISVSFACKKVFPIKVFKSNPEEELYNEVQCLESQYGKLIPIFGYRFKISGDFNGDGKKESLVEHYFSQITHKETNKYFGNKTEFEDFILLTMKKKPISFLTCSEATIDSITISNAEQLYGISFLKNEGDLNGDGADEISFAISYADWSSCNQYHIASYKNNRWKVIYSFEIRDWMLPEEPSENTKFEGLIKFKAKNKIQITTIDGDVSINHQMIDLSKQLNN